MAMNAPEINDDRPGRPRYIPGIPEELDSVIAAPENHEVIIENDQVRVLRVTLPPGQTGKMHTHKWPSVLIITSQSKMVYYNEKMEVVPTSGTRREGSPIYIGPEGLHTVENQGTRMLEGIRIELKNCLPPRSARAWAPSTEGTAMEIKPARNSPPRWTCTAGWR